MEAARERRTPILVVADPAGGEKREEMDGLIESLRSEGFDARRAGIRQEGGAPPDALWEIVAIWVGLEVSRAVIAQVGSLAVEWAKERFLRRPREESERLGLPKSSQRGKGIRIEIVRYEGNEGQAVEIVELEADDTEPVRRPPEGFERNPRFRPHEIDAEAPAALAEDIKEVLPALTLPPLPSTEEDLLRENRERLYQRAGDFPSSAVLDAWLLVEAGTHAAAIRNNIDLSIGTTHILSKLAERERIAEFVVDAARTLRHLRSEAASRPFPPAGLMTAEAIAYINTVARVIAYLARA